MFQENCWYVAAISSEIDDGPLARTVLGEELVFYRTSSGTPAALADRCIHRLLPLSKGWVCGERLQCGYHGALYDTDGKCVEVPGQEGVPPDAKVRSYPVQERYGYIWVWMGRPALAVSAEPCSLYSYLDDAGWDTIDGYIHIEADYELSNDNLADVTHTEFVHRSTLGAEGARVLRKGDKKRAKSKSSGDEPTFEASMRDDGFDARMYIKNAKAPPTMERAYAVHHGAESWGNLDFDLHFKFTAPSFWIFSPRLNEPGGSEDEKVWINGILINTPETRYTTHFFHKTCQNYSPDNRSATQYWHQQTSLAFREDQQILEAQQLRVGQADVFDHEVVSFRGDQLGFMVRKMIARNIAAEESSE